MAGRDNYTFLTTAPVGKAVLTMAVPTIIAMLVTSVYSLVDTFFVGLISTEATAAVGVVFPVMSLIQAFGFLFGQGSGTFISRALGKKDETSASKMATTALVGSIVFGLVLTVSGLFLLRPLSSILGANSEILAETEIFLGAILIGAPFMTGTMTLNNQLRFEGNAARSMIGVLSGALVNVAAVPLFAFGFSMGMYGVALGTLVGQATGFFVLLVMALHKGTVRISFRDLSVTRYYAVAILSGGMPSLLRQGLASVATQMLNVAAGAYGAAAIAGMSIVARVSFVVFAVILGLGQGFQPLCGFCYGARLFDRVREGYFFCLKAGVLFLLPICVLGFVFAPEIVLAMRDDMDVVEVGAAAMRYQVLTFPLAAFITFSNMLLQTSGHIRSANLLASLRNGLCFIPLILLLPAVWGLFGVEICQTIADVLSAVIGVPVIIRFFRELKTL